MQNEAGSGRFERTLEEFTHAIEHDQHWKVSDPKKLLVIIRDLMLEVNTLNQRIAVYEQCLGRPEMLVQSLVKVKQALKTIK